MSFLVDDTSKRQHIQTVPDVNRTATSFFPRVGGVLEYAGEPGSASVTGVDVAGDHTACAVTDTDGRYCWGRLRWGDEVASDDGIFSVDVSSPELMQLLDAVDP